MADLQNFVGGQRVGSDDASTELVDPCTGAVNGSAPCSGSDAIGAAVAAAEKGFEVWKMIPPAERAAALIELAQLVQDNADVLVEAEVANTGKPIQLTHDEEINPMVDQLRFFAGAARCLDAPAAAEYMAGHTSFVRREPLGVIAQVAPWNYPMMMAVWKFAPALAAGNSVVLKPAETTPRSALVLAELAAQVLPPGVFNVVCGDRESGKLLTGHAGVAMAAITGSVRAGMDVARRAADSLKRVHLELGGNAPVIVLDDVDVAAAAAEIATAGYFNAGQDCTAATRVIATPAVYTDIVEALGAEAMGIVTGPPNNTDALYGPLNNEAQLERVAGLVDRKSSHATVVTGGRQVDGPGFFYAPTVVADVEQQDEIVQQEIFGPVITVQRAEGLDAAIEAANDVRYGLASSIWSRDHSACLRAASELDFGCVWINTHIPLVAEMPHGGFKESGYGKDLSRFGVEDYTRVKHVMSSLGT